MCGRFALYTEPVKVARFLQASPERVKDDWQPSWNIPLTERIVGARERVDDNGEITRSLGRPKVPNAFRRTDGEPIVFAGLCEYWKAPDEDEWMQSATIITTSDNPDMHEIHNRMPVILEESTWDQWVNPGLEDLDELQGLLKPAKKGTLEHYPVSKDVGKVDNDVEYLLELNAE